VRRNGCRAKSVIKRYKETLGVVEPFVFWGVKSYGQNKKLWSLDWLTYAAGLMAKQVASHMPTPYTAKAANDIAGSITTFMLFKKCYDHSRTLFQNAWCTAVFNSLAVANAAAFLYRRKVEATWDSCPKVHSLLMEQNIWKYVDKYVQEPLEEQSDQEQQTVTEEQVDEVRMPVDEVLPIPDPDFRETVALAAYDKFVGNGWCRPSGCEDRDVTCRTNGFWKGSSSNAECSSTCAATATCIGFAISSPHNVVPNTCVVYTLAADNTPSGWKEYKQKYHDIAKGSGAIEVKCYSIKNSSAPNLMANGRWQMADNKYQMAIKKISEARR